MLTKFFLPALALAGAAFGVYTVTLGNKPLPQPEPRNPPPTTPYPSQVAGAGIVESSTRDISVGAHLPGIVDKVFVEVGRDVPAEAPLLRIDDRNLNAELALRLAEQSAAEARLAKLEAAPRSEEVPPAEATVAEAEAAAAAARAKLQRLLAQPRPEEVPPAEARVAEAEATLADARERLALWENITDKRAVSRDEIDRRRFAVRVAEARLAQAARDLELLKAGAWKPDVETARAEVAAGDAKVSEAKARLELIRAGTWKPDVEVARAEVAAAKAAVARVRTDLDRLTVKAPVAGRILQVNVRVGEFAPAGVTAEPLILMGDVQTLHLRVDVDEGDAWRVSPEAPARAFVRGNPELCTALKFVRFEPLVVPKRSLTGVNTERTDVRVLQVIYAFPGGKLPVFVGQQMDVFIEAPPRKEIAVPAPKPAARGRTTGMMNAEG
jgi:multidrug efflux pump subunit AcrA (membrane-fusion protein)